MKIILNSFKIRLNIEHCPIQLIKHCSWFANLRCTIINDESYEVSLNITFKVPSPSPGIIRLRKQSAPKYAASPITHVCVCPLNSRRGSLQNLTQVCDTEQLYSGRIKYITTDVPPLQRDFSLKRGERMGRGAAWQ